MVDEKRYKSLSEEKSRQITRLEKEIMGLKREIKEQNESIDEYESTIKKLNDIISQIKDSRIRLNELYEENGQLKQAYQTLKHRHSLLHDVCIEAECDRDSLKKDVISLEKENEQLKKENKELQQEIDDTWTKYENYHGMSIRNTEWY